MVALDLERYLELDLEHWRQQMNELREFFWSARLAQWAPLAGVLAVLRVRRAPIAALLAGWLGAFILVKGFSTRASIQDNTFWRLLMPAWPAYLILLASIPLLVPTLARRLGDRLAAPATRRVGRRGLAVAAALTVALPAVAIAASSPGDGGERAVFRDDIGNFVLTSIEDDVVPQTRPVGTGVELTWTSGGPWRANVFYRIYRANLTTEELECEYSDGSTAVYCYVRSTPIATTRELTYLDPAPPPGGATYRIGVGTNWLDDDTEGDVFAFSPSVTTTAP